MQGQRSPVESLSETFEYEHGSSSSNSGMDQQICWNSMLINPVQTQSLPEFLLPPNDSSMSFVNGASQGNTTLSIWTPAGPSSSERSLDHGSQDGAKMEQEWSTSLTINAGGPRTEERRFEPTSTLCLDNVSINLSSNHVLDHQSFTQNSDRNVEHASIISQATETGLHNHPYNPSSSGSSNRNGSSSASAGLLLDDDGRPGGALDGRRTSCKRKSIEGVIGQSSVSGSASSFHRSDNSMLHPGSAFHVTNTSLSIPSSSSYASSANTSEEQMNQRFCPVTRAANSDCYPPLNVPGNVDVSQRNFRMRMNPANQNYIPASNLWPSSSASRHPSIWSPHEPSGIPFSQAQEVRPVIAGTSSHIQPPVPNFPGLSQNVHPLPWIGASNSRIGSSLGSASIGDRLTVSREELNTTSMPRNAISEGPMFVPSVGIEPPNWILANGSINVLGNVAPPQAGTNSGPTWLPHPPAHRSRSVTEVVRRSLFASGASESASQSASFPLQRPGQSVTSQEIGHRSGVGLRINHQPVTRPAHFIDRNDGVLGVPVLMRSAATTREGRNRMISEIRNAIDLMRRGENVRFEDVFIFDQSMFYGGADLHDRHRDMRLDVDNMSYEELLALEERIGNVSTGLSEETVLKCLKQHKYSPLALASSAYVEPCCICQEEYVGGEDLGTLDCGHDFHAACIKQWLMHKNLCPICKTTALVT